MRENVRDRRDYIPAVISPKHFSDSSWEMCNPPCKVTDLDSIALQKLDKFADLVGFPITINCAYRSKEHEKSKGRDGSSYHCAGRAFDIHCLDSQKRFALVYYAHVVGFNGIGIYQNFVHLDDRATGCLWYGK